MNNKQKYIYAIIALCVVGVYAVLAYFFFSTPKQEPEGLTPTPTQIPVSVSPSGVTSPLDQVQQQAQQGLPITPAELAIREQLIEEADTNGYIHQEEAFTIAYLENYATFQIRLTSFPLEEAEEASFSWLRSQGLSNNGICKLPVLLYVSQRALGQDQEFNPIPSLCR